LLELSEDGKVAYIFDMEDSWIHKAVPCKKTDDEYPILKIFGNYYCFSEDAWSIVIDYDKNETVGMEKVKSQAEIEASKK